MGQDQGSCICNSPKAASELQFRGVISGTWFFCFYAESYCLVVTFLVIALTRFDLSVPITIVIASSCGVFISL
jgi:hypothetical protein